LAQPKKGIPRFESRHPHHAVEDRTSLHFLTPQNGHFLGKRERLSAPKWSFGSNPGTSETERRANSPVFAGFFAHSANENRETGLVGWRSSADRTSLRPDFPTNREFYREFCNFRRIEVPARTNSLGICWLLGSIPYDSEQGNFYREQGLQVSEHGNMACVEAHRHRGASSFDL